MPDITLEKTAPPPPDVVLDAAANWLNKHEWRKAKYFLYDDGHEIIGACALGALDIVVSGKTDDARPSDGSELWDSELWDAAAYVLSGYVGGSVPNWNDRWYRTKGQVVRTMHKAAKRYRKEQGIV